MKAKIYSNEILVGRTDLRISDDSMGVLTGDFIPERDYSIIRDRVWKFNSTNHKNFDLLNRLRFNVQLENGYFIYAIGGISIIDIPEFKEDTIKIEIAGVSRHITDHFFRAESPKKVIEEAWEKISIDQKIAFENELKKEIKQNNRLIDWLFRSKKSHILAEYDYSALCANRYNKDVLFSIYSKENSGYEFALVHLNQKGQGKNKNYHRIEFYKNFDDFKSNITTTHDMD